MASRCLLCANHNINLHKEKDCFILLWFFPLCLKVYFVCISTELGLPSTQSWNRTDRMIGIKNPFKKNVLYTNIRFTTLKRKSLKVFTHTPLSRTRQLMSLRRLRQAGRMVTPQEKVASELWLADLKSLWRLFSVLSEVNTDINFQHAKTSPFGTEVRSNF